MIIYNKLGNYLKSKNMKYIDLQRELGLGPSMTAKFTKKQNRINRHYKQSLRISQSPTIWNHGMDTRCRLRENKCRKIGNRGSNCWIASKTKATIDIYSTTKIVTGEWKIKF